MKQTKSRRVKVNGGQQGSKAELREMVDCITLPKDD